jgi:hypothetical protein
MKKRIGLLGFRRAFCLQIALLWQWGVGDNSRTAEMTVFTPSSNLPPLIPHPLTDKTIVTQSQLLLSVCACVQCFQFVLYCIEFLCDGV